MNFEAKHLIRWGIPGWVYISFILIFFVIESKEELMKISIDLHINSIGVTALIAGIGVVIGYIIHQVSMLFGFIIITDKNKYFNQEYKIDRIIIHHEKGKEIQRIYSHRLGQIHALRALLTSNILSLITLIFFALFISFSC